MLEARLNDKARPLLATVGAFFKLSDLSTPGILDWHGDLHDGIHSLWMESKILKGSRILKAKFRPGQLPFSKMTKALTLCLSYSPSAGLYFLHDLKAHGDSLEKGMALEELISCAAAYSNRLETVIRAIPSIAEADVASKIRARAGYLDVYSEHES